MKKTAYILLGLVMAFIAAGSLTACIEDGITTSPSDQPTFSVDTLKMGTVFTDEVTTTFRFTVHNPHKKGIMISDIRTSGPNANLFRLNVDGFSGDNFQNIEIRENDSIYVFVEATIPANDRDLPVNIEAYIDFVTNGVTQKVVVSADGQDVTRLRAVTITENTVFKPVKPYQIFDSLVVAPGVTLTLPAGTDLRFHDGAMMIVRGTLIANGTREAPVSLAGDRTGNVITDITFDLMSRQWNGLQFTPSSQANRLTHTSVRNTWFGVIVSGDGTAAADGAPKLWMQNCQLRNSGDMVLEAYDADIAAYGCEFAEAANGCVRLQGGSHIINHCTFANYYLFSAIGGAALQFAHYNAESAVEGSTTPFTRAEVTNSVLYGLGTDIYPGNLDGTEIYLRYCLLKSNGTDDANFLNCIWGQDPLYYTVREDYIFDYRLRPASPAIAAGNPALTLADARIDPYGVDRLPGVPGELNPTPAPTLGAYAYTLPQE